MFNLDALKLNSRRAAAFGALAIGTIAIFRLRRGRAAAAVSLHHDAAGAIGAAAGAGRTIRR